jgi:outer membrane protein TolC
VFGSARLIRVSEHTQFRGVFGDVVMNWMRWGACALVVWSAVARAELPEAQLAEEASLETLEALMLERHPALRAAEARTRVATFEAEERGGLMPPELVAQSWAMPLRRPHDFSQANMLMVGARIPIGSPAVRRAEAEAGRSRADASGHERAAIANELLFTLRQTYAEYLRASEELALHEEHAHLVSDLYELAEVSYAQNQASASALHETRVALGKLHGDIAMIEADVARARVRLNLLSGRAPDAALGPAKSPAEVTASTQIARAELLQSDARLREREDLRDVSQLAARRPEWMVGLDYMAMPSEGEYARYGLMLSMSMPWFSSSLTARARRAESELEAERAERANTELGVRMEIEEARVELTQARRSVELVEREWLGHAREAYEVARDAWKSGRSDARSVLERLDALLEARMALVRAQRDVRVRAMALSRALGAGHE